MEEYNNCTHLSATSMDPEWDLHDPYFSAQEDALLTTGRLLRESPEQFRGRFLAGRHMNPCESLQKCGDENLEHFLTAHIIVSSVGGHASTQMQPIDPTDLTAKWGIRLEAACRRLECTTQKRLCTVLHPSLSRRLRTNDRKLRYRRLQHDVFCDTLLAGTKSKRGNKYTEVFVTNFR